MSEKTPVERAAAGLHSDVGRIIHVYEKAAAVALTAAVEDREGLARILAEAMPCTWSIPQEGHPYDRSCLHKRDRIDGGVAHGACWDQPYMLADAVAQWLTGYRPDCCAHFSADAYGCTDCLNTGHAHDSADPCPPERSVTS